MKKTRIILDVIAVVLALLNVILSFAGVITNPLISFLIILATCILFTVASAFGAKLNKRANKVYIVNILISALFILFALWQTACYVRLL